jgi:hypothetical protein
MTAVLVLTGIVVVIIAAIVLLAVPVRHAEAVANGFSWHWSVRVSTRVWVGKSSRRPPSGKVRYVQIYIAGGTGKRRYVYEKLVWRNRRRVKDSGQSRASLRMPGSVLRGEEQIRGGREWYKVAFASEEGRRYTAKVQLGKWRSLQKGMTYRLGRNVFGSVRTVKPVEAAVSQGRPEQAERNS